LGLAFGATSLAGCDKPEAGSLENAKNRKDAPVAPLDYSKLDYAKLDYAKLDYAKLDYSKIDTSRLDGSKLKLDKLDPKGLALIAESNVKLVSSPALADEVLRRLADSRVVAVEAKNERLIADIDSIIKAVELNKGMLGETMCW
jgi:hypothetical protein